jgi:hypothetical protein
MTDATSCDLCSAEELVTGQCDPSIRPGWCEECKRGVQRIGSKQLNILTRIRHLGFRGIRDEFVEAVPETGR